MKKLIYLLLPAVVLTGCSNSKQPVIQGKTEQDEISVVAKIPGRIELVFVQEGDFVNKGDTLAILEIPEVDAKKAQAQAALEAASAQYQMSVTGATQNQLIQLEAKKSALEGQFEFAETSLNRLQAMVQDSLIPQQQYDEVYAKFLGAKAQLDAVKAEIADVKNGVRAEQQEMALGQKNRALGALQEVRTAEVEKYILAPADMTVETITLKQGELALPGYTLFKGPLPGSTYFRFTLPENELGKVQKGMEVNVNLVYENRNLPGKIATVKKLGAYAGIATAYPDYEMQQALFEIKVLPASPDNTDKIIAGTTVTLNLPQ